MYGEVLAHQSKAAHVGGKTDQQIEARCWQLALPRCCFGLGAVEPKMAISTVVDLVDHFKVLHIFGKSSVGLQLPLDYHCDCDKIMGRCQEDN